MVLLQSICLAFFPGKIETFSFCNHLTRDLSLILQRLKHLSNFEHADNPTRPPSIHIIRMESLIQSIQKSIDALLLIVISWGSS